jgi:Flp pilus assembly pilin Flp
MKRAQIRKNVAFKGVSIVEYTLVAALVVVPIIMAVNSPELRTAAQTVFTGTVNTQDTSGNLKIDSFGEH